MKVLLASDGSSQSKTAACFLRQLKLNEDLKLAILSVSMVPELSVHGNIQNPEWEEQEQAFVANHHAELEELFSGQCADDLSMLRQTGNAAQAILEVSKQFDADLIVLGAVGHSMIGRMLLGSVSDRVATHANCSVLVVRPPEDERPIVGPPKKIIAAYDGSTASRESVTELRRVKWGPETEVSIVSVAIPPDYLVGDALPTPSFDSLREETMELGKSAERVSKSLASTIPHSSVKVLTGSHAGETIVSFAEEHESDLIIVGDSGHSRLHDLFIGSTTKYVLRHSPCSVWISRHHRTSGAST